MDIMIAFPGKFDRSHYRVDIKREIVKNPFIYHSFKAMNDFSLKNAVF